VERIFPSQASVACSLRLRFGAFCLGPLFRGLSPWPVLSPVSTRPLLHPAALSPRPPFLPPSAASSREISASAVQRTRWRIPSFPLFLVFFRASFGSFSKAVSRRPRR